MAETAHSDHEARIIVEAARRSEEKIPVLKLLGGNLAKTLGAGGEASVGKKFKCDLGSVLIDGRLYWFVSNLAAVKSRWRGDKTSWHKGFFLAMNSAWLGSLNLATRAHPADGKLDILAGKLKFRENREFRRRAKSGIHLPHSNINYRRAASATHSFEKPVSIYLDGTFVARAENLAIRIEPLALSILI